MQICMPPNTNTLLLHNETRQLQVMILLTSQTVEVRADQGIVWTEYELLDYPVL